MGISIVFVAILEASRHHSNPKFSGSDRWQMATSTLEKMCLQRAMESLHRLLEWERQSSPENSEVEDGHLQKGDKLLLPGMGPLQLQ